MGLSWLFNHAIRRQTKYETNFMENDIDYLLFCCAESQHQRRLLLEKAKADAQPKNLALNGVAREVTPKDTALGTGAKEKPGELDS